MPVALLVRILFWVWFGGAVAAGHFLLLRQFPAWSMPALLLGLAALAVGAYFRLPAVRAWVDALALRSLVLLHALRLIGIYLIALYLKGELPRVFAVSGGIGEIIVAVMALAVVFAPLEADVRLRATLIWNVVGFVGLLALIFTITRLSLSAPWQLRALTVLPLSLLPTFLLPLLLASHVVIFARAAQRPRAT